MSMGMEILADGTSKGAALSGSAIILAFQRIMLQLLVTRSMIAMLSAAGRHGSCQRSREDFECKAAKY